MNEETTSHDSTQKTVGFFVNPIAGVGGELAWKGTFDVEKAWKVLQDSPKKRSVFRARNALNSIPLELRSKLVFLVPEGLMGRDVFQGLEGFTYKVVYSPPYPTTAENTQAFIHEICSQDIDALVFAGGDGTAFIVKETLDECNVAIPVIGVPTGVKITSECYLNHPQDLGKLLEDWFNERARITEAIVSDLNEQAYREQRVEKRVAGPVLTINVPRLLQGEKLVSQELTLDPELLEMELEDIADSLKDKSILQKKLIVGAGTTTYRIFKYFDIEKTLLGVDIIENGHLTHKDVNCQTLQEWFTSLPEEEQAQVIIIITPIGGQGYIFGRGNQQICCEVLDKITTNQVMIVATSDKLQSIPEIKIDTDCPAFQQNFHAKYLRIITSGGREVVRKIQA